MFIEMYYSNEKKHIFEILPQLLLENTRPVGSILADLVIWALLFGLLSRRGITKMHFSGLPHIPYHKLLLHSFAHFVCSNPHSTDV